MAAVILWALEPIVYYYLHYLIGYRIIEEHCPVSLFDGRAGRPYLYRNDRPEKAKFFSKWMSSKQNLVVRCFPECVKRKKNCLKGLGA